MKTWPVIGALMSLLAAAPPEASPDPDPIDDGERHAEPTAAEATPVEATGYAITGPNFHVWDEDREQAENWAFELAESWARAIVAASRTDEHDE